MSAPDPAKRRKRYKLRNLEVDRVDLVDQGANQHAHIIISKRKGDEVLVSELDDEIRRRRRKKKGGSAMPEEMTEFQLHARHDQSTHGNWAKGDKVHDFGAADHGVQRGYISGFDSETGHPIVEFGRGRNAYGVVMKPNQIARDTGDPDWKILGYDSESEYKQEMRSLRKMIPGQPPSPPLTGFQLHAQGKHDQESHGNRGPHQSKIEDEFTQMNKEWRNVDKKSRESMLAFANRWSLPTYETIDQAELKAMSLSSLRESIFQDIDMGGVSYDRFMDSAFYRDDAIEKVGKAFPMNPNQPPSPPLPQPPVGQVQPGAAPIMGGQVQPNPRDRLAEFMRTRQMTNPMMGQPPLPGAAPSPAGGPVAPPAGMAAPPVGAPGMPGALPGMPGPRPGIPATSGDLAQMMTQMAAAPRPPMMPPPPAASAPTPMPGQPPAPQAPPAPKPPQDAQSPQAPAKPETSDEDEDDNAPPWAKKPQPDAERQKKSPPPFGR